MGFDSRIKIGGDEIVTSKGGGHLLSESQVVYHEEAESWRCGESRGV